MSNQQHSIVCLRCGSIGSTEDVLRPAKAGGRVAVDRWVKQCWVCGFEWENPRVRNAS
jgi:ribosomal protein L37E